MQKNLLLLAACGGMLLAANDAQAQETVVVDESVNIDVTNVECKDNYNHSWREKLVHRSRCRRTASLR